MHICVLAEARVCTRPDYYWACFSCEAFVVIVQCMCDSVCLCIIIGSVCICVSVCAFKYESLCECLCLSVCLFVCLSASM